MREGSGLVKFSTVLPERYHDVGIAEQHSVTLAAGMARDGLKPVVAIYSTFLQRAYDQFIHDVAIQGLDITFAVDRAGIVGADGATHTGSFDISYCRCIPDVVLMAPANAKDMFELLNTAYQYPGPALVRYPRDNTEKPEQINTDKAAELGKGIVVRQGKQTALLVFGFPVFWILCSAFGGITTTSPTPTLCGDRPSTSTRPSPWRITYRSAVPTQR